MEVTKSPKYSIIRAGVVQKFKRQRAKKKNVAVLIWWQFGVLTTKLSSGALRHNPDMLGSWK